ncbi:MAG: acyltransferase [Candidatus Methanoperedens sp.]|nr:acyltransferase [Candidatus Methanoperedens sp.]
MRHLETFKSKGTSNSLWYWTEIVSPFRVVFNYTCMCLARISPSLRLKNILYSAMGIKIGKHVSVGLEVNMDIFFPELIEIGENTIIGFNTTILCHEFLVREYRTGKVAIGKNVTIGANTTILPGVRIADNTVVSAHSLVNTDISGFVGGVPARQLKTDWDSGENL